MELLETIGSIFGSFVVIVFALVWVNGWKETIPNWRLIGACFRSYFRVKPFPRHRMSRNFGEASDY